MTAATLLVLACLAAMAQPLPGTQPLAAEGDLALEMVEGIHRHLDRETAAAVAKRPAPDRARFRKIIGVVDPRVPAPVPVLDAAVGRPALVAEGTGYRVHAVRWPALAGVEAEGLLLEPLRTPVARIVALPDADWTPEMLAGLAPGLPPASQFARRLAENGCLVLAPALIDRQHTFSANPRISRVTKQPHREFIYRMAYEMGRHIIGYEVQKVLAAVDWFAGNEPSRPVGVMGHGEGGLLALYAAAADERIQAAAVSGYSGPRAGLWEEPIYRNVWALLREFGDAGVAGLVAPRTLFVEAAPGSDATLRAFLMALGVKSALKPAGTTPKARRAGFDPAERLRRQFNQLVEFTQSVVRRAEVTRKQFWASADAARHRRYLWEEVIGKLPEPSEPLAARTRRIYDEPRWTGYEVVLPVWPDVFASGILLVPKDLKPGERRPVVVCQHGLEGRPRDLIDPARANTYAQFAARLAEEGFVTYAPQNPYIGGDRFRQIQRKANPLKLSLFSFIIGQHQRTLEWLASLPFVDPARIGFYGLSYGGKTAMRVPPLVERYALSICSGDFNEWIWKNTSVEEPFSYMYTGEYEMFEFDLGNTYNYAEMAALIAPRPFMVERGHRDGVGIDEWVAYEYAKVRRHYTLLGIPERTTIEYFDGPHRIHGVGTFEFLRRHLRWPR
ncbi:MAG: dienelactone hydrolase family protein [Acidobacteriota bacterium]